MMHPEDAYIEKVRKMIDFEVESIDNVVKNHQKNKELADAERVIVLNILSSIEGIYTTQRENINKSNKGLFSSSTIVDTNSLVILDEKICNIKAEKKRLDNLYKESKESREEMHQLSIKSHRKNIEYLEGQIKDAIYAGSDRREAQKQAAQLDTVGMLKVLNECSLNCTDEKICDEIKYLKNKIVRKQVDHITTFVENFDKIK